MWKFAKIVQSNNYSPSTFGDLESDTNPQPPTTKSSQKKQLVVSTHLKKHVGQIGFISPRIGWTNTNL